MRARHAVSLPLTRAGVVDVARIRATLAARIGDSALASASPSGPGARQPLDTDAAVALLRRASAGWLRANPQTWQPLLAPATTAGAPPKPASTEPSALRTATLEIVRTVILEVGNALQAAARSDISRDAIARAVRLLLTELRRGLSHAREPGIEQPARPSVDSTPSWAPFSPYGPPALRRARQARARRATADGADDSAESRDEAASTDARCESSRGSSGRRKRRCRSSTVLT